MPGFVEDCRPRVRLIADLVPERPRCRIETSFDGLDTLREQWDRAVLALGGPLYMSYDWCRLWWQFYGASKDLRLFIFYSGEGIVAIVPIYIETIGLAPFRLKLARLVGANAPPRVFDPPVHKAYASKVWEAVVTYLFARERCDLLSFGPFSEHYQPAFSLRQVVEAHAELVRKPVTVQRGVRTVFPLPSSYEEYFNSLESTERKIRSRYLRALERAWAVRTEVVRDPGSVEREFEEFVRQHTSQWAGEGRPGHFHAWPNALEFHRALVGAQGRLGRLRFIKLMAGDEIAANLYTYAFGKTLYAELPARQTGRQWERFSLGCTGVIKLIEAAINEGFQDMESGMGHYDYKVRLNGKEQRVAVLRVRAKGAASRVRAWACSAAREIVTLFAHKIWYRRICPRLPKSMRTSQPAAAISYDF